MHVIWHAYRYLLRSVHGPTTHQPCLTHRVWRNDGAERICQAWFQPYSRIIDMARRMSMYSLLERRSTNELLCHKATLPCSRLRHIPQSKGLNTALFSSLHDFNLFMWLDSRTRRFQERKRKYKNQESEKEMSIHRFVRLDIPPLSCSLWLLPNCSAFLECFQWSTFILLMHLLIALL